MRIAEIDKSYCKKEYGGNWQAMLAAGDCLIFTDDFIKRNFPAGVMWHIANNRRYCRFYDLENKCFL